MSSRDKENKSLQDKFKQFFKRNPSSKIRGSFELTDEIQRDIGRENQVSHRIRSLKELNERILNSNLDTETIAKLWTCIEDIFNLENVELRNAAFILLKNLMKRQSEELRLTRALFFRFIKTHNNPQDVQHRLELLIALTNNGKNVQHFEEDIGPFLLNWFSEIQNVGKMTDFLNMILNVIKFNAVCLESLVLAGLVELICILSCSTYDVTTVSVCLQILETVVAYSNMPADSLPRLIGVLCRTVNNEEHCTASWKVGRNLLGTHMGHSALYTLCLILQEPGLKSQTLLLRGAVFFIHMALWSNKYVASLIVPPNSVLPSFLEVVKTDHPVICYEVILGINALVQKQGTDLLHCAWGIIMEIIKHVNNSVENNLGQSTSGLIVKPLHDTINAIENLIESGYFNGSVAQFYNIIEECADSRPESSVFRLIEYLSRSIIVTEDLWLTNLNCLLNKYFKSDEIRTNIRLAALDVLTNITQLHRQFEEELIDRIVIPHFTNVINDPSLTIRSAVGKALLNMCKNCESKRCIEMLDILEKLLMRPFEVYVDYSPSEPEFIDILCLVKELIEVFVYKMERLPSSHAIKIYTIFVTFLEAHYKKPTVFANAHMVRYLILECFLKIRADSKYRLGYLLNDGAKVTYSPYLYVTSHSKERTALNSPLPQSPSIAQYGTQCNMTWVSIKRAFRVFITCLEYEKDWNVLQLVLYELPKVMKNKPLILSKYGNIELDVLVDVLSPTILDKHLVLPETFPKSVTKLEYLNAYFMVLVTLPSYHACLDQKHQQILVRCLSRCIANSLRTNPKQLIEALTVCCLEMRDVMVKMLPEILLTVSKISPTVVIAIPVLEFLSTLSQLPMVYASFVQDQYMAVFAITSPFTNPFKYNHYTVSLAHYVIAVWFLKCRLPIRQNFVKFITSGLQTNVLTPFEETNFLNRLDLSKYNLDSSDRKRSSSLTEQGPRRRAATVSGFSGSAAASTSAAGSQESKSQLAKPGIPTPMPMTAQNASILTFYEELTETCIDLMARYAFSPCSALPRRTPTAEFLLSGGQSMSWLLGNKLITITTSGCSQKVLKHGLCDKCWNVCSNEHNSLPRSSRSDSNTENSETSKVTRENSNEKSTGTATSPVEESAKKIDELPPKLEGMVTPSSDKYEKPLCACWCQSWAEIFVRRPTGDMSWVMRIQNMITSKTTMNEFPLKELTSLFMPSLVSLNEDGGAARVNSSEETTTDETNPSKEKDEHASSVPISVPGSPARNSPSRQSSHDSIDEDLEYIYDDGTKSRNPVRRSNSSPEMSNWKNPFLHMKQYENDDRTNMNDDDGGKKGKLYSKDMRVSCEAIPEEMAGTTPPSSEPLTNISVTKPEPQQHLSLLSCHSYPGSNPPEDSQIPPKPYQTVPPSPNVTSAQQTFTTSKSGAFSKTSSSDLSIESVKSEGRDVSNLTLLSKLSAKPPQSPTLTTSNRLWSTKDKDGNEIQKSASASTLDKNYADKNKDRKSTGSIDRLSDFEAQRRDRTHTVAGTSSASIRRPRSDQLKQLNTRPKEAPKSGINPSFVFLQLYQKVEYCDVKERPLLIGSDEPIRRAVSVLDRIPPYETHRVGVLYIREGQVNKESEILKNTFGSMRYIQFLQKLGTLFRLQDVDPQLFFLGGLSQNGEDGLFSYMWQDDLVKMIFHIATLMPNKESDPNCNSKKSHIGNNNVTIVYNESGEEYNINTIRSQFNFASIVIHPMDHNLNRITVKCKKELTEIMGSGCEETKIVSDESVAILTRQLALHANLASLVHQSLHCNSQNPYASNWLERLRQIKKIRNRLMDETDLSTQRGGANNTTKTNVGKARERQMEDFTEYTIHKF